MIIVTPYRARPDQLRRWLRHYNGYPLFVVEQEDGKPFNKGALLNVFFAEEGHKHAHCIYHDVDYYLIPEASEADLFRCPQNPTHLAAYSTLMGNNHEKDVKKWRMCYKEFFGGVIALSCEHVFSVNGWTNDMENWSPEDDEIRRRLVERGWDIDRRNGYFRSVDHARDMTSMIKNKEALKNGRGGLHTVEYKVKDRQKLDGYEKIIVSL